MTLLLMYATCIFLLCFSTRYLIAIQTKTAYDTFCHLYYARELAEQEVGPYGEIAPRVVGAQSFSQPFLWHWVIGKFGLKNLSKYHRVINPVLDGVFSVCVFAYMIRANIDPDSAFFVLLVYVFTPMWFSGISTGPRAQSLTPRLASEILVNGFFIVTFIPVGLDPWLVVFIGAVLCALVLSFSKFGIQSLVLLVPIASMLAGIYSPLLALGLGFIIVLLVSGGSFLTSLHHQAVHLANYYRKNISGKTFASERNSIRRLLNTHEVRGNGRGSVFHLFFTVIAENSFTATVIKMPILAFVAPVSLYNLFTNYGGNVLTNVSAIGVSATAIFLGVNIPRFLFIGEAERYVNHVAIFVALGFVVFAKDMGIDWLVIGAIGYGFIFWLCEITVRLRKLFGDPGAEERQAQEILQDLQDSGASTVLCYPYGAVGNWRVMFETDCKTVFNYTLSRDALEVFEKEFSSDGGYTKIEKLNEMVRYFGVDYLIIRRDKLVERLGDQWSLPENWVERPISNSRFSVCQRVS